MRPRDHEGYIGTKINDYRIVCHDPVELEGLSVSLDNLIHRYDPGRTPTGKPHVFVYFLTITNNSPVTVTLLGRKWIIRQDDGQTEVIEGDRIVGETPTLQPGDRFSYNSFHVTGIDSVAYGSFHGITFDGTRVHVRAPEISMHVPGSS